MFSQLLKIYRRQYWSFTTSIYLFKNRKFGNLISITTLFFVILVPATLILISSSFTDIIKTESRPYSYFIFKTDASKEEIARFVDYAREIAEIDVDILPPEKLKVQFFESLGIDTINISLTFPHSAQIAYPPHITIDNFKNHHEYMSNHEIIQTAESNHRLLLSARLAEKGTAGFIWITFLITIIFCTLVSYVSSKNTLILYSSEIKGLILSGFALDTVRRPIVWCGVMNGVILGALLYLATVILATKSGHLIDEYLLLLNHQSRNWGESEIRLLFLILVSIGACTLGAIIASRQIKAEILIE